LYDAMSMVLPRPSALEGNAKPHQLYRETTMFYHRLRIQSLNGSVGHASAAI